MSTPAEVIRPLFDSGRATSVAAVMRLTGLPRRLVSETLRAIPQYQSNAPPAPKLKTPRRWKVLTGPGSVLSADLMDVRRMFARAPSAKRYDYCFVIIDHATRFVSAALCNNKTAAHVAVMSKAALRMFPFEIPDDAVMITDSGNEFQSEFRQAHDTDEHTIVIKEATHARGAQLAERAIREIRRLAWHHAQQTEVDDPVQDLHYAVDTYNLRRHSAFHGEMSPRSAATHVTPAELRMLYTTAYQAERAAPNPPAFAVGDRVRVRRYRSVFEKSNDASAWSAQVFSVDSVRELDGVNLYRVRDARGRLYRDSQTEETMSRAN